jgi:hypothetical protein
MPGLAPIRTSLFALSITTLFFSLPRITLAATVDPRFPFTVPVDQGATCFQGGDQILITEVRGTANELRPGNRYQIKGQYRLVSHPEASLTAGVVAPNGSAAILSNQQSMTVQKGIGQFTLVLPYVGEGQPRITFTTDAGESFGNLNLISTQFPYAVAFDHVVSSMQIGDDISITDIRSSSGDTTSAGVLQIIGTYYLSSRGTAKLTSLQGNSPAGNANQFLEINQGSGDFTIVIPTADSTGGSSGISLAVWPAGSANTPSSTVAYKLGKSLRAPRQNRTLRPLPPDPDLNSNGLLFNYSMNLDNGKAYVDDTSFVPAQFPFAVPFKLGLSSSSGGDSVEIGKVRGTSKVIQIGGYYRITGSYTLSSSSEALLATYVTIGGKTIPLPARELPQQSMRITRGSGSFSLILPVRDPGWPHVAIYPMIGGQAWVTDSATHYFGTGDTVLKNWNQPVPQD